MLRSANCLLLLACWVGALGSSSAAQEATQGPQGTGPGRGSADRFHPEVKPGEPVLEAAYGGSLYMHMGSLPQGFNRMLHSTEATKWVTHVVHDSLLHQDWETWALEPRLAESYLIEDALVLKPEAAQRYPEARQLGRGEQSSWRLFGALRESAGGYRLRAGQADELVIAREDVQSLERGTVFTFRIRPGILWHDGHGFDEADVLFSWECFQNPHVDASQTRSLYGKLIHAEIPEAGKIRFFYGHQFFSALESVGEMPIIPRHLFDLNDPDLRAAQPELVPDGGIASLEQVGRFVNENPHNVDWVGLGPYRLSSFDQEGVIAERFDGFWDAHNPRYGGYVDRLVWRHIADDKVAFQAALAGEIDLFTRLSSEDYDGAVTASELFKEKLYKGYYYTGTYSYTAWNAHRPYFKDVRVREALALLVDMESFAKAHYQGRSKLVSGPAHYFSKAYNQSVPQPGFDPERAVELLEDAGWYDRDGDGIVDRDGQPFAFEMLHVAGKIGPQLLGAHIQAGLARAGIKLTITTLDFSSLLARMRKLDFDAYQLAWVLDLESDPEQVWHSKWAPIVGSSNFVNYADRASDELIEAIQVELDVERRMELWNQLHARIASQHPYLFGFNNPYKFAMNKRFRGLRTSAMTPGYSALQIYLPKGSPGTRAQPKR